MKKKKMLAKSNQVIWEFHVSTHTHTRICEHMHVCVCVEYQQTQLIAFAGLLPAANATRHMYNIFAAI